VNDLLSIFVLPSNFTALISGHDDAGVVRSIESINPADDTVEESGSDILYTYTLEFQNHALLSRLSWVLSKQALG
jgi:hypothetical protein